MQDKLCKLSRMATVVVMFMVAWAGSAWASGVPWQVGDIVVCYGGGNCNVIRLHGSTVQVLDTISSGLLGHNSGVGLNNTLHVLATDDGTGTTHSNVVVYSIASIQPFLGTVLTHNVINNPPYDGSGGGNGSAAALAVSNAGHIFVGNSGPASLVELDSKGNPVTGSSYSFTIGECATNVLKSVDLSSAGDAIYVTAGDGIIRKVSLVLSGGTYTLAGATCAKFADFGSLVNLYGIKDIPANALSGTCGANPPNPVSNPCPTGESVLVVAKGFTDPDADTNETTEPPSPNDPDAVNICTNLMDQAPVSCGLLLDTAGAGLNAQPWIAKTLYPSTNTTILDPHGHLQQVSHPGTSGSDEPTFDQSGGITDDNLVIWTNQGQKLWSPTHTYSSGDLVVDSAGHVQKVTTGGTSAATEPNPWTNSIAPNFGGMTTDGLKWTDQGQKLRANNQPYNLADIIVDSAGHVQKASTAGTSAASPPSFSDTPPTGGGTTVDGLQWVDVVTCNGCTPAHWAAGHPYSIGDYIQDTNTGTDIWTVYTPGTSGTAEPTFIPPGPVADNAVVWTDQGTWVGGATYNVGAQVGDTNSHLFQATIGGKSGASSPDFIGSEGGSVYDNPVTWTDQGTWQENHPYTLGEQVGDTGRYLWQETNTKGTSAPAANAPDFTSHDVATATIKDGLQWTDQPNPSVLARYPAPASVTTLQSLALDPLVSNCTGTNGTACSTGSLPTRKVTDSGQLVAVLPSFWMGDNGSGTIYRQNFAGGAPASFNAATGGNGVQGLVVYGGESANQPGLASLVINGTLNSGDSFTASPNFLGNSIKSTLSNNSGGSPPATKISLYGSAVDPTSCFNDPSAGSIFCKPFSANQALVLKIDIPLNGNAVLPNTQTLNTAITPPVGFFDNGTDVFVDEQFDDTTFVGGDPGTRTVSVHSLHEITVTAGGATCTYSSPVQNSCYKTNRGTLNFSFTCTGLTQTQFQSLQPMLSLVKKNSGQAPLFIPLAGTNGKAPYRFDAKTNSWVFQWNVKGAAVGTYQGTTFDNSFTVQSFPVTFFLQNSCP